MAQDWTPPDYVLQNEEEDQSTAPAIAAPAADWSPPDYVLPFGGKKPEATKLPGPLSKVMNYLTHPSPIHVGSGAQPDPNAIDRSQWPTRADGSGKGDGFLGLFKLPNGVTSEYSIADSEKLKDEKGNYLEYPTLVPTLTKEEVQQTLDAASKGAAPPQSVKDKAEAYALKRKEQGLSLFATPGEENYDLHPDLERMPHYQSNYTPPVRKGFFGTLGDFGKHIGTGVVDIGGELNDYVNENNKKVKELINQGDYPSALKQATGSFGAAFDPNSYANPVRQIRRNFERNAAGNEPSAEESNQAKDEAINQIVGVTGLPVNRFREAYSESDYPRIFGQILGAVAAIKGGKYVEHKFNEGPKREAALREATKKTVDDFEAHKNVGLSTPQQDAVAISLTKDYLPRTPASISAETGIPKSSIRRTLSELDKRGIRPQKYFPLPRSVEDVPGMQQPRFVAGEHGVFDRGPLASAQEAAPSVAERPFGQDVLGAYLAKNPEAKMADIEAFLKSVPQDQPNVITNTEIPDLSVRQPIRTGQTTPPRPSLGDVAPAVEPTEPTVSPEEPTVRQPSGFEAAAQFMKERQEGSKKPFTPTPVQRGPLVNPFAKKAAATETAATAATKTYPATYEGAVERVQDDFAGGKIDAKEFSNRLESLLKAKKEEAARLTVTGKTKAPASAINPEEQAVRDQTAAQPTAQSKSDVQGEAQRALRAKTVQDAYKKGLISHKDALLEIQKINKESEDAAGGTAGTVIPGRTSTEIVNEAYRKEAAKPENVSRIQAIRDKAKAMAEQAKANVAKEAAAKAGETPKGAITRTTPETRGALDAIASTGDGDAYVVAGKKRYKVMQSNYGMFGRAIGGDIRLADNSEVSVNDIDHIEDAKGNKLWSKPQTEAAAKTTPNEAAINEPTLQKQVAAYSAQEAANIRGTEADIPDNAIARATEESRQQAMAKAVAKAKENAAPATVATAEAAPETPPLRAKNLVNPFARKVTEAAAAETPRTETPPVKQTTATVPAKQAEPARGITNPFKKAEATAAPRVVKKIRVAEEAALAPRSQEAVAAPNEGEIPPAQIDKIKRLLRVTKIADAKTPDLAAVYDMTKDSIVPEERETAKAIKKFIDARKPKAEEAPAAQTPAPTAAPKTKGFNNPFAKLAPKDPNYEGLWNSADENAYSKALDKHLKDINDETDPSRMQDNYDKWTAELKERKLRRDPDNIETAGILRDEAYEKLKQSKRQTQTERTQAQLNKPSTAPETATTTQPGEQATEPKKLFTPRDKSKATTSFAKPVEERATTPSKPEKPAPEILNELNPDMKNKLKQMMRIQNLADAKTSDLASIYDIFAKSRDTQRQQAAAIIKRYVEAKTGTTVKPNDITEMKGGLGAVGGGGDWFKGKRERPDPFPGPNSETINKMLDHLDQMRDNIFEQQVINRKTRAIRFSNFEAVKERGWEGAARKLGTMRGTFDKVNPGERLDLSEDETNSMFDAIDTSDLTTPQKMQGFSALFALMNGDRNIVPSELKVLDRVYGSGFADKIDEMYGGIGGIGIPGLAQFGKAGNTAKSLLSSGNLAAPLLHGMPHIFKKEYRVAFGNMIRSMGNKETYQSLMQAIKDHPNYQKWRDAGLFTSNMESVTGTEEDFGNSYIGNFKKWTGVQQFVGFSKRGYSGFLDTLRFQLAETLKTQAEAAGQELFPEEPVMQKKTNKTTGEVTYVQRKNADGSPMTVTVPTKLARDFAKTINYSTDRGNLGKLEKIAPELNYVMWAPRRLAARISMLNPKYYMDLEPMAQKEAIKNLLSLAATGMTLTGMGVAAGGTTSFNPLEPDFLKVRFGNRVINPLGPTQSLIVAAARAIKELHRIGSGEKQQFGTQTIPEIGVNILRAREAPLLHLADEIVSSRQWMGGAKWPDRQQWTGAAGQFVNRYGEKKYMSSEMEDEFTPIFVQNAKELLSSDENWGKAIGLSGLSFFGLESQNIPERKSKGPLAVRKQPLRLR